MSQPKTNRDNQANNLHSPYNRGNFRQGRNHRDFYYSPHYNNFQYFTKKYNFQPRWGHYRGRKHHQRPPRKPPAESQRSPSPFSGTEEYTLRKIQEASDMIKKRLLMPPEADEASATTTNPVCSSVEKTASDERTDKSESEKSTTKNSKKALQYNVEEIHDKIITHITNLNHGKKVNLICATSTGYDEAIQQIQKQKRLELSKALRDMCSNQTVENSEVFNAIMPDIGIKIEELPLEVIQELSSTLDLNFEETSFLQSSDETVINVKTEVDDNHDFVYKLPYDIKQEVIDCSDDVKDEAVQDEINGSPLRNHDMSFSDISDSSINLSPTDNKDISEIKTEVKNEFTVRSDCVSQVNDTQYLQAVPECSKTISVSQQTDAINCKSISTQTETSESNCPHFQIRDSVKSLGAAIEVMLDIDKEIARLTELRQAVFINMQINKTDVCKKRKLSFIENNTSINALPTKSKTPKIKNTTVVKKKLPVIKKKATPQKNSKTRNTIKEKIVAKKATPQKEKGILKTPTIKNQTVDMNLTNEEQKDMEIKEMWTNFRTSCTNITKEKDTTLSLIKEEDNLTVPEETNNLITKETQNLYKQDLDLAQISEKILVMRLIGHTLVVASEHGNIFFISIETGKTLSTIQICKVPITSLCTWKSQKTCHLFVGSFEPQLHQFNFSKNRFMRTIKIGEPVQCLEQAWNWIFIGTANGNLVRYSLQRWKVDFEEKISKDNVLVLKATQEGARRVLLVGSRNAPVVVRDAMSGLHLRTMNEIVLPTVYTLLLENSMVYCGTTFHDILVYNFHDGNLVYKHQATNSKGVCCMKVVENLLFASCHNGNIYVYNVKNHKYVGVIEGPGGVILSMEVFKNIVIVGTMSLHFKSILIPEYIFKSNEI